MNIPMPPVRNEYRVEGINVVFAIMAYRRLTAKEITFAVALYLRQHKNRWPKPGTTVTILSQLGQH